MKRALGGNQWRCRQGFDLAMQDRTNKTDCHFKISFTCPPSRVLLALTLFSVYYDSCGIMPNTKLLEVILIRVQY